jgi:hypothetical protein
VVGEPLQLEHQAPERHRASGDAAARERLDDLRVRGRVPDGRVAGEGLHLVDRALGRPADERALHAAVLVAERDLEVEDLLAVALEAEVAGLDHARVHRADGDLVHRVALDAVEVGDAGEGRVAGASTRVGEELHRDGHPARVRPLEDVGAVEPELLVNAGEGIAPSLTQR